ncbi:MAG: putative sulfate exporter family transporter [Lautropia sp.]|nr:putative sulfate exporter family transporter [Lautropia sp.]
MSQHATARDSVPTPPASPHRSAEKPAAKATPRTGARQWHRQEDGWAIIIGLGLVLTGSLIFLAGGEHVLKAVTVEFSSWENPDELLATLGPALPSLIYLYALLLIPLSIGAARIGYSLRAFSKGLLPMFVMSVAVTLLANNDYLKSAQLEAPLIALFIGLAVSNTIRLPAWLHEALRTEYYVKTGIVLMGATLPFSIIMQAGPTAIGQALIVSFVTFGSIYFAATRLFGLDRRFAAALGAGGSICGVSGAIAIGGACRAKPQHVSVAISLVVVWSVVMIFVLPAASRLLGLPPGVAGAWIGTSEFADAAGFAAAQAIGDESAVQAFTLMKVVGRDMFVGIWAFLVAMLSVTLWEKKSLSDSERVDAGEIWHRFPKFIIGFFLASLITTAFISLLPPVDSATYSKDALAAMKSLRGWFFTLTFLAIGLTTRFRDLTSVGIKPFWAFAIGVAINVPLGYYLSTHVFADFWNSL